MSTYRNTAMGVSYKDDGEPIITLILDVESLHDLFNGGVAYIRAPRDREGRPQTILIAAPNVSAQTMKTAFHHATEGDPPPLPVPMARPERRD